MPGRTEITVQTDRLLIIRRRRISRVWCEKCGREVDMVGLAEAGMLARIAQPMLPGGASPEGWHVCQHQDREPRVCLESLLKSLPSRTDAELRAKTLEGGTL